MQLGIYRLNVEIHVHAVEFLRHTLQVMNVIFNQNRYELLDTTFAE